MGGPYSLHKREIHLHKSFTPGRLCDILFSVKVEKDCSYIYIRIYIEKNANPKVQEGQEEDRRPEEGHAKPLHNLKAIFP